MDNELKIHTLIEDYAKKAPNDIAILDERSAYTYRDLDQNSNQLANYIQKFSLKPDTLIAIAIDRSYQLLIAVLSVLKAHCAYLPLEARYPTARLQYIFEDTNTPLLITESKFKNKFTDFTGHVICIDEDWRDISSQSQQSIIPDGKNNNLAYVIYTSGSTGRPKGVLIEHKSVVNYIQWFKTYALCQQQTRIDFSSNIIFDMAVTCTVNALAQGLQVSICPEEVKRDIREYLFYLHKNKINIVKITPSYFKILVQEAKLHTIDLSHLKMIILGGEILLSQDCIVWLEMYPQHILFNEYGPTETTVGVTQYKITRENVSTLGYTVPIGKPGLNIDCTIVKDGKPVTDRNTIGELYIEGSCLANGYLNQKELTESHFLIESINSKIPKRRYKTGDLCQYLADGNIEFLKRIDDQVKIRGYRIELGEIEACLMSNKSIKACCVIAREDADNEKKLIAYYIPQNDTLPSTQELRQYLSQRLPEYMVPVSFVMMDEFPLNENGKLNKNILPDPFPEEEHTISNNPIERQLIEIWRHEFHFKDINVQSHFFELGGHSLTAARIVLEIEKKLGKSISIGDLYKSPTISKLATIIAKSKNSHHYKITKHTIDHHLQIVPLSDFQFIFWLSNLFEPKIKKINIISRRRVSGKLNISALTFALKWVVARHETLSYQIAKYKPIQYRKTDLEFKIIVQDVSNKSFAETESALSTSLNALNNYTQWQKNKPYIIIKLFYLKDNKSELQVCVPHTFFDDASEELLFEELSRAYQSYINGARSIDEKASIQYDNYVMHERKHLNHRLKKDIVFWQKYLQDTSLLTLPEAYVQHIKNAGYSTYLELPFDVILDIQKICAKYAFSITDLLCASVTLTFKHLAQEFNNKILINIVRSVRENKLFDKMIGCFLRLDLIKVDLTTNLNLIELAKKIQQSRIETEPHQACSGMVKLACLNKTYKHRFILNFLIRIIVSSYCMLFPKLKLNPIMLMMYGRLNSLRTKNQFLININLLNNFIATNQTKTLFGLRLEKAKTYKYDLTNVDNNLDICLLRNESIDKSYLVISCNLDAGFRHKIGNEIIHAISIYKSYLNNRCEKTNAII